MSEAEPRSLENHLTNSTRRVLVLAQEEALLFNHNHIGTEHILLGLIREGSVERVLANCNVPDLSKVRYAIRFIEGEGDQAPTGEIGLTPRAKKIIEHARDAAKRDDERQISTTHLLEGMVREDDGTAVRILISFDVDLDKLRRESQKIRSQKHEEVLKRTAAFFEDPEVDEQTKDGIKLILENLINLAIKRKSSLS